MKNLFATFSWSPALASPRSLAVFSLLEQWRGVANSASYRPRSREGQDSSVEGQLGCHVQCGRLHVLLDEPSQGSAGITQDADRSPGTGYFRCNATLCHVYLVMDDSKVVSRPRNISALHAPAEILKLLLYYKGAARGTDPARVYSREKRCACDTAVPSCSICEALSVLAKEALSRESCVHKTSRTCLPGSTVIYTARRDLNLVPHCQQPVEGCCMISSGIRESVPTHINNKIRRF